MPPNPHTGDGPRCPSPDPTPLGAPALRAYCASLEAFGPSIVPNQKSWIHPWAHPPSESPGYAYVFRFKVTDTSKQISPLFGVLPPQ